MAEYLDLFKGIIGNQDLVDNLKHKATEFITGTGQERLNEAAIQINSSPILTETFSSLSWINNTRNIITGLLIAWSISLLVVEYLPSIRQEDKDNMKYFHKVFFGNLGIITMIFILWSVVMFVSVIIPAIVSITPQFSELLSTMNKMIKTVVT